MKNPKFLIVGDFEAPIHEEAIYDALEAKGVEVRKFEYRKYFIGRSFLRKKYNNLQKKILWGTSILSVNRALQNLVRENDFDCIFFYRPRFIKKATLAICKEKSIVYFYNNDDPFSSRYNKGFWKDYFAGLPFCNHIFYYRDKNRQDYISAGYENISLLRSYFIGTLNYKIDIPKKYDVVFIGHYENDGRDEWMKYLFENGVNLKLFGPEWHRSKWFKYLEERNGAIAPLGNDYNKVINEAKIALVFLSTLNSDTYTRRCFEIPATGTFMLAQYSDDLASMFESGKEADYFQSKVELLNKIKFYLSDEKLREQIALRGMEQVNNGGHEVNERVSIILNQFEKDL